MILKAEKIAELLELGEKRDTLDPLVITPTPNLSGLRKSGAASVDLRLGTWFVMLRQPRMTHLKVDDQEGSSQLTKIRYVPFGDEYVLHPRNFVLGVTLEWLRLPKELAAYVIGRSSWGRRSLIIETATGGASRLQGMSDAGTKQHRRNSHRHQARHDDLSTLPAPSAERRFRVH
jgi:dCTP deaminase